VTAVPPGDVPEQFRRAWVGLILPLAAGETGPHELTQPGGLLNRIRGWFDPPPRFYFIDSEAAFGILGRAWPVAAEWWRANAARVVGPGNTIPFEASVCTKVVRLKVGGREVVIDGWMLTCSASSGQTHVLRRVGEDRMILTPTVLRCIGILLLVLGGFLFLPALVSLTWERQGVGRALLSTVVGLGTLAIGISLWVFPRRFTFDRSSGLLRISWPERRRLRSLGDVLALQLLRGSARSRKRGRYAVHQLNLVLDDDLNPRQTLTNHGNREASRRIAAELAEFLNVPLLDEVPKS
jgi:hypothetical protein